MTYTSDEESNNTAQVGGRSTSHDGSKRINSVWFTAWLRLHVCVESGNGQCEGLPKPFNLFIINTNEIPLKLAKLQLVTTANPHAPPIIHSELDEPLPYPPYLQVTVNINDFHYSPNLDGLQVTQEHAHVTEEGQNTSKRLWWGGDCTRWPQSAQKKPWLKCCRHFQICGTAIPDEYVQLCTKINSRLRINAACSAYHIKQDPVPATCCNGIRRDAQTRSQQAGNEKMGKPRLIRSRKDWSIRFCVDYRSFGAITLWEPYPLCCMDECIDTSGDAIISMTIGANYGHWQIVMSLGDHEGTAFTTSHSLFQFTKKTFALRSAHATFQKATDVIHSYTWTP